MLRTCALVLVAVLAFAACGDTTAPVELLTADTADSTAVVHHLRAADGPAPTTTTTTTLPPPTTTTTVAEPSTVTTMPPSPPVHAAAAAPAVVSDGQVNGYPCGGDLPTCQVLRCESGGNPTAENPTSSASGLWQILDGTWDGFGGYGHASHAPAEVQNAKARDVWAGGAGRSHWAACL